MARGTLAVRDPPGFSTPRSPPRPRHLGLRYKIVASPNGRASPEKRQFGPGGWDGEVPWKRSSLFESPQENEEEYIRAEIEQFAPMSPRTLSMQEVLDMLDPERMAKFIHVEVLVRFAERIRSIEDIEDWEEIPELAEVLERHVEGFRNLRLVKRRPTLDAFTDVVRGIVESQRDVQQQLACAMHRLREERGPEYGSDFADPWLDKFLLNTIGTEMLMGQYLACIEMSQKQRSARTFKAGVVDPDCDVAQLCRDTAVRVRDICQEHTGRAPLIRTEVYTERGEPRISHVPGFLKFILTEVLKNSCRATAELVKSDRDLQKRPISIIVCADNHHVAIRISDRARGIPFEVGSHVWSYLYTTADKGTGPHGERANSLAGFGVGLPLSRLYARYLGGSLELVSLPGYGTSVDLFLTRISKEQREVVPDEDLPAT